jgi:hypothetical protein
MHLQPPLELSRCHLIAELHKWICTIINLSRIRSDRYQLQVNFIGINATEMTYRNLLGDMMEHNPQPLIDAYGAIEGLLEQVEAYVKVNCNSLICIQLVYHIVEQNNFQGRELNFYSSMQV